MDGCGEEIVLRCEAVDAEREIVWLREKKRRVEAERFTGAGLGTAGRGVGTWGLVGRLGGGWRRRRESRAGGGILRYGRSHCWRC